MGRLEVHVFSSSLDSRSVGCSSTVRKELGLVKLKSLDFGQFTVITYWRTLPWLEQFLECGAILIGNEAGTNSKTKMRVIAVKLCREWGHLIHSLDGVFAGRGYLWGNNRRILDLSQFKKSQTIWGWPCFEVIFREKCTHRVSSWRSVWLTWSPGGNLDEFWSFWNLWLAAAETCVGFLYLWDWHLKLVMTIGLDRRYQLTNCKGGETGTLRVVSDFHSNVKPCHDLRFRLERHFQTTDLQSSRKK